jgi:hypothetical protein
VSFAKTFLSELGVINDENRSAWAELGLVSS